MLWIFFEVDLVCGFFYGVHDKGCDEEFVEMGILRRGVANAVKEDVYNVETVNEDNVLVVSNLVCSMTRSSAYSLARSILG